MKHKKNKHKSKGQSLLELVIGLTLLIVIVSVIAIATANGLRSSQHAKNQVQATKLAQDGIEKIRSIRDRLYGICGVPSDITNPNLKFSKLWTETCQTPPGLPQCPYLIKSATTGDCPITDPFWLKLANNQTESEAITVDGVTFDRRVLILDSGSQSSKEVRVTVEWKDTQGVHSSYLTTILTNY